jgi:hypothetical protein
MSISEQRRLLEVPSQLILDILSAAVGSPVEPAAPDDAPTMVVSGNLLDALCAVAGRRPFNVVSPLMANLQRYATEYKPRAFADASGSNGANGAAPKKKRGRPRKKATAAAESNGGASDSQNGGD